MTSSKLPPHLHPDALRTLGELITGHPKWEQDDQGRTWCNFAVDFVSRVYGFRGFVTEYPWPQPANTMHETLIDSPQWEEIDLSDVTRYAMFGCLVVTSAQATGNGHVCAAMPEPMQVSGAYGGLVPVYSNVGPRKYHGFFHLGWCIHPNRKPKHFLFVGEKP